MPVRRRTPDEDVFGRGFALPIRLDAHGRMARSSGEQRIRESIVMILGTEQGERLMRPDFGCRLRSLVFAPNNAATVNLARFYIEDALARWEPRIERVQVEVDSGGEDDDRSGLRLRISYRIKATGDDRSLTFLLPLNG
ncbi:MAG: GPW/gp25 family protein [Isosphaeraceae bacterium]